MSVPTFITVHDECTPVVLPTREIVAIQEPLQKRPGSEETNAIVHCEGDRAYAVSETVDQLAELLQSVPAAPVVSEGCACGGTCGGSTQSANTFTALLETLRKGKGLDAEEAVDLTRRFAEAIGTQSMLVPRSVVKGPITEALAAIRARIKEQEDIQADLDGNGSRNDTPAAIKKTLQWAYDAVLGSMCSEDGLYVPDFEDRIRYAFIIHLDDMPIGELREKAESVAAHVISHLYEPIEALARQQVTS